MVGGHRAGEDGRLGGAAVEGHPRQAGRLRVREDLTRRLRLARGALWICTTRPSGCSTATSRTVAATRVAIRCRGESTTYADVARRRVAGPARSCANSASRPGERVAAGRSTTSRHSSAGSSAACVPASCPVPLSTMSTGHDLAAIVADAGPDVVVVSADYADRGRLPSQRPRRRCVTPSSSVADDRESPIVDARRGTTFTDATEAAGGGHRRHDDPAFWLYSSGTTGLPKGVMHRHGSLQATAETYAREVLGDRARRPLPVGGQAVLRLRARQLADVPASVRRDGDPRTRGGRRRPMIARRSSAPSSRRCSSPAPASSPHCSTPTCPTTRSRRCGRRSPPARRCPPICSGGSANASAIPVLDGIGTTEALHIFLSNTLDEPAAGHQRHAGARLRRPACATTTGADVTDARHARATSTSAVPRSRPGYWQSRRGDGRGVPGRLAAHGRRVHALRRRLLDVPRPQQRHDQGRRDLGVAGRGRERAGVASRRARSGGRRFPQCPRARRGRRVRRRSLRPPRRRRVVDAFCRDRMASFKRPRRLFVVDELPKTATGKIQRYALRAQLEHVTD